MGYPAATGRDGGLRAPSDACQLSLNREGPLVFICARAWRIGLTGRRGEPPAQKRGAVCADRLAKKRPARASGVFIGTITCLSSNQKRVDAAPIREPETRQLSSSRGP